MFDSYLKLERNAAMERAINRCRKTRLKAHTVSVDARLYSVPSRSKPGTFYVVKFNVANGQRFAACNCTAGQRGQMCVHIAAAYVQHVINMAMRRQAEELAARNMGCAADDAGAIHPLAPAEDNEMLTTGANGVPVADESGQFIQQMPAPTNDELASAIQGGDASPEPEPYRGGAGSGSPELFCGACGRYLSDGHCEAHPRAEAVTERELRRRERENAVLIRPEPVRTRMGGFDI